MAEKLFSLSMTEEGKVVKRGPCLGICGVMLDMLDERFIGESVVKSLRLGGGMEMELMLDSARACGGGELEWP